MAEPPEFTPEQIAAEVERGSASERDKDICRRRFAGATLAATGAAHGLSAERVRGIVGRQTRRAVARLTAQAHGHLTPTHEPAWDHNTQQPVAEPNHISGFFSVRLTNGLHVLGITTLPQLRAFIVFEGDGWQRRLMGIPNVGRRCVEEITAWLDKEQGSPS
jgi:hypothetical protein